MVLCVDILQEYYFSISSKEAFFKIDSNTEICGGETSRWRSFMGEALSQEGHL